MFGLKVFTKTKTKKFANDKDRKQYYAIQGYYKKKSQDKNAVKSNGGINSKGKNKTYVKK